MNRTAADDNMLLLMQLAALPLAMPPIPYPPPASSPAPGFMTPDRPRTKH